MLSNLILLSFLTLFLSYQFPTLSYRKDVINNVCDLVKVIKCCEPLFFESSYWKEGGELELPIRILRDQVQCNRVDYS